MRTVRYPVPGLGLVVAAAIALALAGCSSGSSAPPWAAALGTGTTVTAPQSAAPGHGSPGAAVQGYVGGFFHNDIATYDKDVTAACGYLQPSAQSACTPPSGTQPPSGTKLPYAQHEALGYIATHGKQALVGTTGTTCVPGSTPECETNNDPAAIFSSAKPFATLWSQAQAAVTSGINSYALVPCIQINGQWYIDVPPPSS
jgi:hypothetical protein